MGFNSAFKGLRKRVGDSRLDSFRLVFLSVGSDESRCPAKGCRGFRATKMSNDGEALLAVILHVRTKLLVTTFDTNHFVTDITQTVNRCFNLEAS
jgi:hypothetical protein